jgi:hypothetical protein
MARRRRRFWKILLGILIVLFIGLIYAAWPGSSTFTVSPETTHVTGPIDKHGYVDYVAALNERLRGNIKPEENANVLIWQALGPHPEGANMPPEYFEWLGVPQPPEVGDYFLGFGDYLKQRAKIEEKVERDEYYDRMMRASKWSWGKEEEPQLYEWLHVNEKSLEVAIQASKRPEYYNPLVPRGKTDEWSPQLMEALLPALQKCREIIPALTSRAMLLTTKGDAQAAWQDLLACHRFARLLQRGGTLIEMLVGIAMEHIVGRSEMVFVDRSKLSSQAIISRWHDVADLPPMSAIADKVDLTERFVCLQMIMGVAHYGPEYINSPAAMVLKSNRLWSRLFTHNINFDSAFRNANRWYDRISASMRMPNHADRQREINGITSQLMALKLETSDPTMLFKKEIFGASYRGENIGNIIICLLAPAMEKVHSAAERNEQNFRNLHLAFALAAYHADTRRYPEALAELAPKYIDKIPDDLFSGQPLIYRLESDGYLLYSVGVNGVDDGGQGYDDDPKGDDLVIRMPAPEPKLKK